MGMEELVGKTIAVVHTSDISSADYMLFTATDGEQICFEAVGDCCAHAFFYQWQGLEDIVGDAILSVDSRGHSEDTGYGQLDTEFISIRTHRAQADIEFRVDHNGYYCGLARRCAVPGGVTWYEAAKVKEMVRLSLCRAINKCIQDRKQLVVDGQDCLDRFCVEWDKMGANNGSVSDIDGCWSLNAQ